MRGAAGGARAPRWAALLTDFGCSSPYAGIMKGVLLSLHPAARVVDLCHGIAPYDLRSAAFALMESVPYFPAGTLFVCVVDPGVGSARRVLWADAGSRQFLAPDNGLLSWAARDFPFKEVRALRDFKPPRAPSATFHGRDLFAPAAAALLKGLAPSRLGPRVSSWLRWPFPRASREGKRARGEILCVDRFGNAVTSLSAADFPDLAGLRFNGKFFPARAAYAAASRGAGAAIRGSHGFWELAAREGSFARLFKAKVGRPVSGEER